MTLAIKSYNVDVSDGGWSTSVDVRVGSPLNEMDDPRTFHHVQAAQWEVDDSRILLFHEDILGEAFEVENNILR